MADPYFSEQKDPESLHPSLRGKSSFAQSTNLSFIELSAHGLVEMSEENGILDEQSLPPWLSKRCFQHRDSINNKAKVSSENGDELPGGLRLLYAECSFDNKSGFVIPLRQDSFKAIEACFGLPKQFLAIRAEKGSRALKHTSRDQDGKIRTCFVFKLGLFYTTYYHLALSYSPHNRVTHGLLLCKDSSHNFPTILAALRARPECISQPLFLASLVAEVVIESSSERIQRSEVTLNELEEALGQHEYVNMRHGDPLQIDFITTTRHLNFLARTLGSKIMRLGAMILALEKITEFARSIGEQFGREKGDGEGLVIVEEQVAYLLNECQASLLRAEFNTKRKEALIKVVYQFMAHKNANANIELAEDTSFLARASKKDSEVMKSIAIESKKDTAAMKTLAILGMVFLPGTFIATIFAMPVLGFDADGTPVLKPGFKYYCAVAIPITFLMLLLWTLAMVLPWKIWLKRRRPESPNANVDLELGRMSSGKS